MVVKRWAGSREERRTLVIGGITLGRRSLGINDRDVETLASSISERVLAYRKGDEMLPPLLPRPHAFKLLSKFKTTLLKVYGDLPTPLEPNQFVECYKGRKKAIYQAASEIYLERGVNAGDARISAFVKAEKVPWDKSPRAIQPRTPVYNVGLGVYLKHVEHELYVAIAKMFKQRFVVSKGLNVTEIGNEFHAMWNTFSEPVFVGFDASRFDLHVSVDALKWEHSIYNALYPYASDLRRLLKMQLINRGKGRCDDGYVKYKCNGRRMSGDMNTALGNCLIVCGIYYVYMKENGIRCKFVDNGDDCGVILEKRDQHQLAGVEEWFAKFGFRLEVEAPVYDLERVVFCQMQPVQTMRGWTMCRQITKALEKDSMTIVHMPTIKMVRKWMYSVGECGLALCSGVPIMQELYSSFMRLGMPSNMSNATYMECGARHLTIRLASERSVVTDDARYSFWKAFGIMPEDQKAVEDRYRAATLDPHIGVKEPDQIEGLIDARLDQDEF